MNNAKDYNIRMQHLALMRGKAVADMRATGRTWAEIGKALGVSRQRAQQIGSRIPAAGNAAPDSPPSGPQP